jgi:hypothetical protein
MEKSKYLCRKPMPVTELADKNAAGIRRITSNIRCFCRCPAVCTVKPEEVAIAKGNLVLGAEQKETFQNLRI